MSAEGWYRRLLWIYPASFRARFGADLEELFIDLYRTRAAGQPLRRRAAFWWRIAVDTLRQGLAERLAHSPRRLPLHVHRTRGPGVMRVLVEDVRHAVGSLRQQRTISAVILITLALAIGANSAIFTVVRAVLLRPLPYGNPERVVILYSVDRNGGDLLMSVPDYEDLRGSLSGITGLSGMGTQTANLTGAGEPDRLRAGFVGADFFSMLRVQPVIGRGFARGDDEPGAPKTAILEYDVWQSRFGGDPAILGRVLVLNNEPHQVIGVLPRTFEFPISEADIWLPLSSSPVQDRRRESRYLMVFGRVADGVPFDAAEAELRQAAAALGQAYPETNGGFSMRVQDVHSLSVMFVERNLQVLMAAVLLVLLIACANVANLLLARASSRQREIALRAALGASRGRIIRQLLAESVVLAAAGGALGLVLSASLTSGMLALLPNLPRAALVRPDAAVVAFTVLVSIATGIAFGLVPAARLSRPDLRRALSEGSRDGESRGTRRLRSVLVVAELSLSLVLLAGAGLLIQSLVRLTSVDLGYDPRQLLTLEYRLPRNKYTTPRDQFDFHRRVVERLTSVAGVRAAAIASSVPQSGNGSMIGFWRADDPQPSRELMPRAQSNLVLGDYFGALGIPLISGRSCGPADTPQTGVSVVINQLLAEQLWPNEPAVGKRLRSPEIPAEAVVVGVVGNTRPNLISQPNAPQIYGCLAQSPGIFATVILKTEGEPMTLARSVQQAIWSVDPDQPMWKIRSSESMVQSSVQRQRFVMLLMSCAAGLALLLAGLGTYSVLSYTVQRRAREVGVRMALGATRASILRLMLAQTALLIAAGVVIGLAGALALGRLVATQLYEVSPRDPATLAATSLALVAVSLAAAWLPAQRATGIDPIVTLKQQ